MPVIRSKNVPLIQEVMIDDQQPWRQKFIKMLEKNYSKAPCYREMMPWVRSMILYSSSNLSDFNRANVMDISCRLGFKIRFVRQSELKDPAIFESQGSRRLAAICNVVKAEIYLAGDGSQDYEDEEAYSNQGIQFQRNEFQDLGYLQCNSSVFSPGLSILDALLNLGLDGVSQLLQGKS